MEKPLDEVRKHFYARGYDFFCWNSGKNTPNILNMLSHQTGELEKRVAALNDTVKAASDSSTRLSRALNRITIAAVFIAVVSLGWEISKTILLP